MSTAHYFSPFTGSTFEILAGPEQTRFVAHASVLEKSEKLRAVTRGSWKDSSEFKMVLEDWDPETVGRLLEWLYTGDYKSPYPAEAPPSQAEDSNIFPPDMLAPFKVSGQLSLTPPKKSESAELFQRRLTSLRDVRFNKAELEPAPSLAGVFERWPRESHSVLDLEATLLAHAKLYALADYMLLPNLQAQAFQHVQVVLGFINPSEFCYAAIAGLTNPSLFIANTPVIDTILTLIKYVYANTTRPESGEEPLRELISTFIAVNYDQFGDEGGVVQAFMEQGGDFQGDVHDKVRRYQVELKEKLEASRTKPQNQHLKIPTYDMYSSWMSEGIPYPQLP